MKTFLIALIGILALSLARAQAQVVVVTPAAAWQNYISADYGIPASNAVYYQSQLGNWADVATALFVAKVAHTTPERIIQLRMAQTPWSVIAADEHISPNALYIPAVDNTTVVRQGPPYGKAWGYWRKHPNNRVVFTDAQFENRAVLLGTSQFYNIPANTEVQLVQRGTPFNTIIVQHEREREKHEDHDNGNHDNGNHGNRHDNGKHRSHED